MKCWRISLKVLRPFSGMTIEERPPLDSVIRKYFPFGFSFRSKKNFLFSTLKSLVSRTLSIQAPLTLPCDQAIIIDQPASTNRMRPISVYLDHNATTPPDPAVVEAMMPYLREAFGNPSSVAHRHGREAREAVEGARAEVAHLLGADP